MTDDNMKLISKDEILPEPVENVVKTDGEVSVSTPSEFEMKVTQLKYMLANNRLGCEIKWGIFMSACQSYKVNSCLRPFPPGFIINGNKEISKLFECVQKLPSFSLLEKHLHSIHPNTKSNEIINLLHWVLIEQTPILENIPKSQFDEVFKLVQCESGISKPNFIFQVKYSKESSIEINWKKQIKNVRNNLFAFHGSRLDNFHSILHHGLQQHLTKNSLFGQGVYLASELCISLIYSPYGSGWVKSSIGSELSVVALCEIIDAPDGVKCQIKDGEKSRALAQDSIGGEVPHKYYVVQNSNLVKLKYIFVYARKLPSSSIQRPNENRFVSWIRNNKLICFFGLYFILLVFIGLCSNQSFQRMYKMWLSRISIVVCQYLHLNG